MNKNDTNPVQIIGCVAGSCKQFFQDIKDAEKCHDDDEIVKVVALEDYSSLMEKYEKIRDDARRFMFAYDGLNAHMIRIEARALQLENYPDIDWYRKEIDMAMEIGDEK